MMNSIALLASIGTMFLCVSLYREVQGGRDKSKLLPSKIFFNPLWEMLF